MLRVESSVKNTRAIFKPHKIMVLNSKNQIIYKRTKWEQLNWWLWLLGKCPGSHLVIMYCSDRRLWSYSILYNPCYFPISPIFQCHVMDLWYFSHCYPHMLPSSYPLIICFPSFCPVKNFSFSLWFWLIFYCSAVSLRTF